MIHIQTYLWKILTDEFKCCWELWICWPPAQHWAPTVIFQINSKFNWLSRFPMACPKFTPLILFPKCCAKPTSARVRVFYSTCTFCSLPFKCSHNHISLLQILWAASSDGVLPSSSPVVQPCPRQYSKALLNVQGKSRSIFSSRNLPWFCVNILSSLAQP